MKVIAHLFQKVVGCGGERVPVARKLRTDRVGRRDSKPHDLALDRKGGVQKEGTRQYEARPQASGRGTNPRRQRSRAVDSTKLGNGTFLSLAERSDCTIGRWALSVPGHCRYMLGTGTFPNVSESAARLLPSPPKSTITL